MTNNLVVCNKIRHIGNPMQLSKLSRLLKVTCKKEAVRLEKLSQARYALFASECKLVMDLIEELEDNEIRTFLLGYFKFQYNIITRLDDSTKFCLQDLRIFHQFSDYRVNY